MAATVTFCRLLGRSGPAALSLPRGARCLGVRTSPSGEKITHTGQVYDDKDYRKIRFVGRHKEVSKHLVKESRMLNELTRAESGEQDGGKLDPWAVSAQRNGKVNENFAIDLIAEQPVSEADRRVVACDGGGGALGHPKVYINLDKETKTGTCGYCGLQFRQQHHH